MTKPLPKPDVEVRPRSSGPARLNSAERQMLEEIEDPTIKRLMGEVFLAARANQDNFDEIRQWFPIQPEDASDSIREGAEYSGEGAENDSEADEEHFWLRWLRASKVTQSIRGWFGESLGKTFHVLRLQSRSEPFDAAHNAYVEIYSYDNDKRNGVIVVAGGNSAYLLRKEEDGSIYSDYLRRAELFAKGDLISAKGSTEPVRLAVGSDGKLLVADSTTTSGLKWKTVEEAGLKGLEGRWAGLKYTYSTNTEETDPTAGKLKFDKTTLAEATSLRISETDGDGNALAAYLASFDDSTNTVRGHLILRKVASPTVFAIFMVSGALTDKGTWDTLVVTHVASNGLANNDVLAVEFIRAGDKGAEGAKGEKGAEGAKGEKGEKGAEGAAGAAGANGTIPWTPIAANGISQVSPAVFEKLAGAESVGKLISSESYVRGCFISWKPITVNKGYGFGLNTDPLTDEGFASIDYFFNCTGAGAIIIRESGVEVASAATYVAGDVLSITYDGRMVRYWRNATLIREVARAVGSPLFFDSWWNQVGSKMEAVEFGPMGESVQGEKGEKGAAGEKGEKGEKGAEGAKGAEGPKGTGIAVRLATNAALAANTQTGNKLEANANGAMATIDGVAPAVADRVLVKNEAGEGKKHGLYSVISLGSAGTKWVLERVADMDAAAEFIRGQLITVEEGTVNALSIYSQATVQPVVVNTTSLSYEKAIRTNSAGTGFQLQAAATMTSAELAGAIAPSSAVSFVNVTGTTEIKKLGGSVAGHLVVFKFTGAVTVVDGENLKLKENFVSTENDTLTLIYNGENWYEVARSAN